MSFNLFFRVFSLPEYLISSFLGLFNSPHAASNRIFNMNKAQQCHWLITKSIDVQSKKLFLRYIHVSFLTNILLSAVSSDLIRFPGNNPVQAEGELAIPYGHPPRFYLTSVEPHLRLPPLVRSSLHKSTLLLHRQFLARRHHPQWPPRSSCGYKSLLVCTYFLPINQHRGCQCQI